MTKRLSRVLDGYDEAVTAPCAAWNAVTPEHLRSLDGQTRIRKIMP